MSSSMNRDIGLGVTFIRHTSYSPPSSPIIITSSAPSSPSFSSLSCNNSTNDEDGNEKPRKRQIYSSIISVPVLGYCPGCSWRTGENLVRINNDNADIAQYQSERYTTRATLSTLSPSFPGPISAGHHNHLLTLHRLNGPGVEASCQDDPVPHGPDDGELVTWETGHAGPSYTYDGEEVDDGEAWRVEMVRGVLDRWAEMKRKSEGCNRTSWLGKQRVTNENGMARNRDSRNAVKITDWSTDSQTSEDGSDGFEEGDAIMDDVPSQISPTPTLPPGPTPPPPTLPPASARTQVDITAMDPSAYPVYTFINYPHFSPSKSASPFESAPLNAIFHGTNNETTRMTRKSASPSESAAFKAIFNGNENTTRTASRDLSNTSVSRTNANIDDTEDCFGTTYAHEEINSASKNKSIPINKTKNVSRFRTIEERRVTDNGVEEVFVRNLPRSRVRARQAGVGVGVDVGVNARKETTPRKKMGIRERLDMWKRSSDARALEKKSRSGMGSRLGLGVGVGLGLVPMPTIVRDVDVYVDGNMDGNMDVDGDETEYDSDGRMLLEKDMYEAEGEESEDAMEIVEVVKLEDDDDEDNLDGAGNLHAGGRAGDWCEEGEFIVIDSD